MPTQLEILGQQFYKQEITRNKFTPKNEYNSNNPDALSDGDEMGKG